MLGRKTWFGPRPMGWRWGWVPVSPEGWAVTLLAIMAAVCMAVLIRHGWRIALIVVVALLIIMFLKGTSPGGTREWEEYQTQNDRRDPRSGRNR